MKYALIVAVIVMIALSIVVVTIWNSAQGTCTVVKEVRNTEAGRKAVLFLVQAHATVADSYQVSVVDATTSIRDGDRGNAFVVDGDHGRTVLGSAAVDLRWQGADTLRIVYDRRLRTFAMNTTVDGVAVVYEKK
mgnify:CR=1 FL=1